MFLLLLLSFSVCLPFSFLLPFLLLFFSYVRAVVRYFSFYCHLPPISSFARVIPSFFSIFSYLLFILAVSFSLFRTIYFLLTRVCNYYFLFCPNTISVYLLYSSPSIWYPFVFCTTSFLRCLFFLSIIVKCLFFFVLVIFFRSSYFFLRMSEPSSATSPSIVIFLQFLLLGSRYSGFFLFNIGVCFNIKVGLFSCFFLSAFLILHFFFSILVLFFSMSYNISAFPCILLILSIPFYLSFLFWLYLFFG